MASYGSTSEPGIVTNVTSALTVGVSGDAPADVGIVGQADLGDGTKQGSATPNEVYQVTRATKARDWFGEDSLLTQAVVDALDMGANPVYTVAASEVAVTGEDLSGVSSTSGNLAESPCIEDASEITLSVDSDVQDVTIVLDDPSTYTPGADEAFLNPVESEYELETVPSTSATVDYVTYDYQSAIDAMQSNAAEAIDFLAPVTENNAVSDYVQSTLSDMAVEYNFALGLVGAATYVDPLNYENRYDDSRMQVVYPTRNADGDSVIGSYAGLRATTGIRTTPIKKLLDNQKDLIEFVNKAQRGSLIDERVVPLKEEAAGARVMDDVNSVSDSNSDESNIRYGFSRLVIDYAINTVRLNESPFIGRLNRPEVRDALEGLLNNQLKSLIQSNAIIDFTAEVFEVDATTASVELQIDTADPLRFIENDVTVGA